MIAGLIFLLVVIVYSILDAPSSEQKARRSPDTPEQEQLEMLREWQFSNNNEDRWYP